MNRNWLYSARISKNNNMTDLVSSEYRASLANIIGRYVDKKELYKTQCLSENPNDKFVRNYLTKPKKSLCNII
jgi:hypothetical protein